MCLRLSMGRFQRLFTQAVMEKTFGLFYMHWQTFKSQRQTQMPLRRAFRTTELRPVGNQCTGSRGLPTVNSRPRQSLPARNVNPATQCHMVEADLLIECASRA